MKFNVVKITNNLDDYPECKNDTENYPSLVEYVDDEMELFIVDEEGNSWAAGEFFFMVNMSKFFGEIES